MRAWHEKAEDEIDQQLADGLIDQKEYQRQMSDLRAEMRDEAEEAGQRAYNDAMGGMVAMSKERLIKAVDRLPKGFHVHSLSRFVNGNVRTTKKGTVNVPIEIPIKSLGSPFDDLRAVLSPEDNKLIPVLVFIDLDEVEA